VFGRALRAGTRLSIYSLRRCLDRLYSLSLFTGSLQDLQGPYLHGVPRNNASAGRSCWYGRNSLFSAEIPPMRLARVMPPNWQSANESRARLSTISRRPWGRGAGPCKPRHTSKSSWRAITPSERAYHGSNASRSCTLPRVHTVLDITSIEHLSVSTGQELSGHCLSTTSPHDHTSICSTVLLLVTIIKSRVCYEEQIPLDTNCQSRLARYEALAVGGFPSAPATQRIEPKRLHSAWLTSCATRHHTACTLRQGSR
jgi:hypothetical protein